MSKRLISIGFVISMLGIIVVGVLAQPPTPVAREVEIVGGQPADPNEYPWQALVLFDGYMCGGSLIAADWILTAAHCVYDDNGSVYPPATFDIWLGEHDLNQNDGTEQNRSVSTVHPHPNYNANSSAFDIALLKLSSPATLNNAVNLITLNPDTAIDGENGTVTGWGATSYGGNSSDILLEVVVPIVSNATCNAAYGGGISADMLCAGAAGKDSCQGDSGGPLIIPNGNGGWDQAGVVSWGYECANPAYYGVYARVSAVKSWIDSYLGTTSPTPTPTTTVPDPTATATATAVSPTATPTPPEATVTPINPGINDDFNSAATISALPYRSQQNTAGATQGGDDPDIVCGYNGAEPYFYTVWYQYTATNGGQIAVDTRGSDYDTLLAVWRGNRGALQMVACNDDISNDVWQSALALSLTDGETYYIEVASYDEFEYGQLRLNLSAPLQMVYLPLVRK